VLIFHNEASEKFRVIKRNGENLGNSYVSLSLSLSLLLLLLLLFCCRGLWALGCWICILISKNLIIFIMIIIIIVS